MSRIATVAMKVTHDKKKNMATYISYIKQAASENVELLLFPELSLQGFPPSMATYSPEAAMYSYENAEVVPDGPSVKKMVELAKIYKMYICWGMDERDEKYPDKLYNTAVLVGPKGYVGKYRKIHLPGTERLYKFPGEDYRVFDTEIGRIGIMICFDKMFPEVARILRIKGAEIILCPTAWPALSKNEEDSSLHLYKMANEMRAIENNVFIVDSNNVSDETPDGFECGHSRILDPNGNTLITTGFEEGIAITNVDLHKGINESVSTSMATYCNYLKDRAVNTYNDILLKRAE